MILLFKSIYIATDTTHTCFLVKGNVAAFTITVSRIIANP